MAKEVARKITAKEKEYLLSLTEKDIDLNLLKDLFAYRKDQNPKFQPFDEFTLNEKEFYNKAKEETTVGRFIFNKYALGENLLKKLGYQNKTMGKGGIGDLDDLMSKYLLTEVITSEDMAEYIDRVQYFGFATAKFMNAALTIDLLIPPENVEKRKAELSKELSKELEAGNVLAADKMEKELLGLAKETVKYIPDQQIYDSGCRGSYGNNYKNSTVMRGAIRHLSDDKITISTKSLVEGIPQEEFAAYADLITQASYNRAIGTREGGYEGKKLMAAFQGCQLDEPGSDCGSKGYLELTLTKDLTKFFQYRYIIEGNKLKLLTPENIKDYIGKTVKFRSPLYCKGDKYCSKCFGELYYMLGIENVGILTNRIASRILNISLKAFHDLTLKIVEIDIDNYID